jgi:CubicO group peptidase (beta-lactamase class C family)
MRRSRVLLAFGFVAVLVAAAPAGSAIGSLSSEEADRIRAFVRDALDQLNAPGAAVVIVSHEGIEFAEGFGSAQDDGTPVTPQTPFSIASLSKELTGFAVMQLVSRGEMRLEATVHDYLPWFGTDGSQTALITVRDLLSHASGFSTRQGLANAVDGGDDDDALERGVRRLAQVVPAHAIGEFEYSNANYDILGYLVAIVSGESYDAYMTERVLGPLEMRHTHLTNAAARADGLAQGYYPFFGIPIAWDIAFRRASVPSAFIASSAEDLGHVLVAHLNHGAYGDAQVLEPSAVAQLHRPLIHPDPWDGYGYGWWTNPFWAAGELKGGAGFSRYDVPVILEHTGTHQTYASAMVLVPAEDIGVVVLINLNDQLASSRFYQLHTGIAQILLGRGAPALVSYDSPLAQNGRVAMGGWAVGLALLVAWSVRRYRRWSRDPASTPRGRWAVARRIGLPMAVVLVLSIGFWWLVLTNAEAGLASVAHVAQDAPDLAVIALVITVFGLGWALSGTVWTVRLLRESAND